MASSTEFLDLLMKDPVADKADTFNIETMLNENWRKIDTNAKKISGDVETISSSVKPLCSRYTIEKIVDVTLTEATETFYIELPQTLSNYPVLIFKMVNLKGLNVSTRHFYAVESTESTEALYTLAEFAPSKADGPGANIFQMLYPTLNSDGTVSVASTVRGVDTKYLYCHGDPIYAGCHFEIWGAVK